MTDDEFSTFMQASVLAGMAIAYTGTSIPHGLSYTLTYENGVPHGNAVGVFLSGFLKKYGDSTEVEYVVKQLLGFDDIDAFRDYIRTLFGKLDMSEELWKKDRDGILANPAKLKNYPLSLRQICLTITFAIITHKKSCQGGGSDSFFITSSQACLSLQVQLL